MSIKIGENDITQYLGANNALRAYLWADLVYWEAPPICFPAPTTNLIAEWKLDGSGNDTVWSNNLTPIDITYESVTSACISEQAVFSWTSAYFSWTTTSLLPTTGNYSISIVVDITSVSAISLVLQLNSWNAPINYNINWIQINADKTIRYFGFNWSSFVNLATSSSFDWEVNIVITKSWTTYKIYVNWNEEASWTLTVNTFTVNEIYIWANENVAWIVSDFLPWKWNRARIYTKTLNTTEVSELYSNATS